MSSLSFGRSSDCQKVDICSDKRACHSDFVNNTVMQPRNRRSDVAADCKMRRSENGWTDTNMNDIMENNTSDLATVWGASQAQQLEEKLEFVGFPGALQCQSTTNRHSPTIHPATLTLVTL
jgi:hypothetical protein